jgi:poly(A) polymerase
MPIAKEIEADALHAPRGEQAYRVCETLHDAGFEAWWVGGCVRDMVMGIVPKDIDIATNALPKDVAKLFKKSDESASHLGVVIVSIGGHVFEVTTFREETVVSNGRHPESVAFTDREHDAARRDITINALYWNPISRELFDPFGGEKDLNERLIRIIGEPDVRIQHDALRLLRVIRFRALIGGQYHPETFKALHKNAKLITILSGSRQFEELEKILMGPAPQVAFEDMWETDILEHLLPELHACKGVGQPKNWHEEGDVWNHLLQVIASFTDDHNADTRFAGLFHDIGKPKTFTIEGDRIHFNDHASVGADIAADILQRLQCPSKRKEKIRWLVKHHMMMGSFFEMPPERKAHWYYHPWFTELLQVFWLDCAGSTPSDFTLYEKIIDDYNHFLDARPSPEKPLLSGDRVMEILRLQPGEKVGQALQKLHDAQVKGEVKTKKEAEEFLKKMQ